MRFAILAYEDELKKFSVYEIVETNDMWEADRKAKEIACHMFYTIDELEKDFLDRYWEDDDDWDQTASFLIDSLKRYKVWEINEEVAEGKANEELKAMFSDDPDGFINTYCAKLVTEQTRW